MRYERRITNGNCTPPFGRLGYAKPQSGLRPLCGFVYATFGAGVNASRCPVTCPKRQLPVTLCEIGANWLTKWEKYYT